MADVISDNVPKGTEIKWYGGGVFTQLDLTGMTGTAGALGGSYLAEYGSLWVTVNGVQVAATEKKSSAAATESSGTDAFTLPSSVGASDAVIAYFVDISTVTLKHIASCKDVKGDNKASSKKESVQGQATQITTVGTVSSTASLEDLLYTLDFVGLVFGDTLANAPNSGWSKWSNKTHGFKKIGALVGKRYDSVGTVIDKFFLIGALANTYGQNFPTEDMGKESFSFDCDYIMRARKDTT
jgi:hypothetical protein